MKKKTKMFRQGDLLFKEVEKIPEDAKEKKDGVIAEGEITGHKHQLRPGTQAALMIAANVAYVHAVHQAYVDHQEHETIDLPAGDYCVKRQREFTPEGWRQVAD